jgi:hypothetical protein
MSLTTSLVAALLILLVVAPFAFGLLLRRLARAIGARSLAAQPDRITLEPVASPEWRDAGAASACTATLRALGFRDAGTFRVAEMPGVIVRLLTHEGEAFHAAVCEHPAAGGWLDIVTLHADGSSATFSTAPATGLDPRDGDTRVNAPGTDPSALLARARTERPRRERVAHRADGAAADFARAYAEETAWRKRRGIGAREVGEVAARMDRGRRAA